MSGFFYFTFPPCHRVDCDTGDLRHMNPIASACLVVSRAAGG